MFLGTHQPRLDEKGRLVLPAVFRHDLEPGIVITKGQERCLFVWPEAEFQKKADAIGEQAASGPDLRAYNRLFFASANSAALDKQGRLTLPASLRDYAGLTRDCAVIGANNKVEIWDLAAWDAYQSANEPAFAEVDEGVLRGPS